ncbi:adhesin [Actinomycetes bacterium KLBMP 9797]
MVTLTDNAIGVIRRITDRTGTPGEGGVRMFTGSTPGSLSVQVTEQPHEGDKIVDTSGARLFLDAVAAHVLDDKVLDASIVDGSVTFSIAEPPQ